MFDSKFFEGINARIAEVIAASPAKDIEKNMKAKMTAVLAKLGSGDARRVRRADAGAAAHPRKARCTRSAAGAGDQVRRRVAQQDVPVLEWNARHVSAYRLVRTSSSRLLKTSSNYLLDNYIVYYTI
jgi:hypothetical protein